MKSVLIFVAVIVALSHSGLVIANDRKPTKVLEPERLELKNFMLNTVSDNFQYGVPEHLTSVKKYELNRGRIPTSWKSHIRQKRDNECGVERLPGGMSSSEADTYNWLDFNPKGIIEPLLFVWNYVSYDIDLLYENSRIDAANEVNFIEVENTERAAIHHALWMYRVTKQYGSGTAKAYGDAKERSSERLISERTANLYNNKVGRCLAGDHAQYNRNDMDVIRDALKSGKLQITRNEPENKQACKDISGDCRYTSDCRGQYVSGKCPDLPNDIKCCIKSSNEIANAKPCEMLCGRCKHSSSCSGQLYSGKCPTAPARVKCCVPTLEEPSGCDGKGTLPCNGSAETGSVSTRQFECIAHHIANNEGKRCYAYDAQPGNPDKVDLTIAYGFNLKRSGARTDFENSLPTVNFDDVYAGHKSITSDQAYLLLKSDLPKYINTARSLFPTFDKYRLDLKIALVDGVYRGDHKSTYSTTTLINEGKWEEASVAYIDRQDYRDAKKNGIGGIVKRLDANAAVMKQYGKDLDNGVFTEHGETC